MQDVNDLMARVKDGDRHAFDEIVVLHRKAAILFAYSFVSDFYVAEDIVQDCFVKIYVIRESYKQTYSFKTYLYTMIRNRAIDHLRANNVKRKYLQTEIERQELSAEEEVLFEERYDEIAEVFNNLKGERRTALYLYAVSELSYKEIAVIMRRTVPQIKIIIYRARKELQESWEKKL